MKAPRVGAYCPKFGLSKRDCPCAICLNERVEAKKWNRVLAQQGLSVEAGTPAERSRRAIKGHNRRRKHR